MKKGSSLKRKLAQYSVLASPVIALATVADAQIVYTDIIPDKILHLLGDEYGLDLNNDGVTDFKFKAVPWRRNTDFALVNPFPSTSQNQNAIGGVVGAWQAGAFPFAFNGGQQIDSNMNWVTIADIFSNIDQFPSLDYPETWGVMAWYYLDQSNSTVVGGNWDDQADKYLPLRLHVSGNTYYGWARLTVPHAAIPFTIKDYAYNLTPDKAIVAGDTTGAIEGIYDITEEQNSISLFPNPNRGEFTVGIKPTEAHDAVLSVMNILGEKVFETKISFSEKLQNNTLDLRNLPKGVYTIRVNLGEKVSVRKFVIQ